MKTVFRYIFQIFTFVVLAVVCAIGGILIAPFNGIWYAFSETFLVPKSGKKRYGRD